MTPAARVAAAITVLDDILGGRSAEQALSAWARSSRFAGSKDRAALRDLVFDALRKRASCAALGGGLTGRGLMVGLGIIDGWDMAALFSGEGHGPDRLCAAEDALCAGPAALSVHDAHDLPEWLWPVWCDDLQEQAETAAQALRSRAPLYLRVNRRRTTMAKVAEALTADGVETCPHPEVSGCLQVLRNPRRVQMSPAYVDGLVEVQDAASQLAIAQLDIPDGARVLDYCAGGGGKALALADRFNCMVVAHDVSTSRMRDIAPRAARAGVTITLCDTPDLKAQAPFDVVVVDAPCSGSGTWARNPEAKWALTKDKINDFSMLQGEVLSNAATLVKAGGQVAYMTCSVFAAENASVVAGFIASHPDWSAAPALQLVPGHGTDGFYCQVICAPSHFR